MMKHWKAVLLLLLAALLALGTGYFGSVKALAAEATTIPNPELDTSALNAIAAAISSNAAVIQDYVDTIDVSEVKGMMDNMSEFVNAPFAAAPAIVFVVLGFVMIMMVVRKVIGR